MENLLFQNLAFHLFNSQILELFWLGGLCQTPIIVLGHIAFVSTNNSYDHDLVCR